MSLTLSLPVAPTANNAYLNRKSAGGFGRLKSTAHRRWLRWADAHYMLQHLGRVEPVHGPYACEMVFPGNLQKGDLDGRVKLLLDYLVKRRLVDGDSPKHLRDFHATFEGKDKLVQITIRPMAS